MPNSVQKNRDQIAINVIKECKNNVSAAYALLKNYVEKIDDEAFLNNLGLTFYQQVEYELAKQTFEYALKAFPKSHFLYNNYGLTLNRLGQGSKAVKQYQKAIDIKKDYHQARSNLAYTQLYFGTTGRKEILAAHQDIQTYIFPSSINYLTHRTISKQPDRMLKIAYLSADLRNHAVGSFMSGILKSHDVTQFEICILDNRPNNNDEIAQQLKENTNSWTDISAMSTTEVCNLIVQLEIDILIDLSGHTKGGRPDVFANRCAPIQINYLGYPATTGLQNIDYRIVDRFTDSDTSLNQVTEKLLYLNHAMWNYQAWPDMPKKLSRCPFEYNGYITFGSANNHAKLQESWLKIWARVLTNVPNSKLCIKSRSLKSPAAQQQLLQFFQNNRIANDRIQFVHYSPYKSDHWQALQKFDIALDSFPYNGTTTSCDLLNLGIPIVTRAGNSHVSRTTGSILNTLELNDWIANSPEQFVDICIEKSKHLDELRKLRQSLSIRFNSSTLGNPNLFIIEYEHQLKNCWHSYCQQTN